MLPQFNYQIKTHFVMEEEKKKPAVDETLPEGDFGDNDEIKRKKKRTKLIIIICCVAVLVAAALFVGFLYVFTKLWVAILSYAIPAILEGLLKGIIDALFNSSSIMLLP